MDGIGLLAAAVVASPAPASIPGAPAPDPFMMNGVRLGISLEAWRALPRPVDAQGQVVADCQPHAGAAPSAPRLQSSERMECRYVGKYGAYELPASFPLRGRYRIRQPVFEFVGGRLAAIRFRTSTDAFSQLMATLRSNYGPPQRVERDTVRVEGVALPRVAARWARDGQIVSLTDPSSSPDQLEVRMAVAVLSAQ